MKGNIRIINTLNGLLAGELSAADQYFVHSRMYQDWGLNKLYERLKHEQEEELEHAASLIERILFLEGLPDLATREPLKIGQDVPGMIANDLDCEYFVADNLRAAITVCEEEKDYGSRDMLLALLKDTEEDHMYWLEKQMELIHQMGLENYVQSQM